MRTVFVGRNIETVRLFRLPQVNTTCVLYIDRPYNLGRFCSSLIWCGNDIAHGLVFPIWNTVITRPLDSSKRLPVQKENLPFVDLKLNAPRKSELVTSQLPNVANDRSNGNKALKKSDKKQFILNFTLTKKVSLKHD